MTKIDSLRRYLLPCFSPSTTTTTTTITSHHHTKKRLSTSLRDDIILLESEKEKQKEREKNQEEEEEECSSTTTDDDDDDESVNNYPPHHQSRVVMVPPRSSKSMVIGTLFGHRRGHVSFCIQHDRLNSRPSLLLDFSIPTQLLVKEMGCGLVRITLECNRIDLISCSLNSVPIWSMCINGRKVGFATRRRPNDKDRLILKTMKSSTVGAGVIPTELTRRPSSVSSSISHNDDDGGGEGELIYMRANYERVIGSLDSESYHLVNLGGCPDHELSVFLLRSR